ncbi:hypothetical protein ACHAW5_004519 [Stephanodiscus triporus]|uniref:O-fucosyltransferase family protein n=1 Tax=Stephanodiscus triporus TaxID=2934178 RepID=A0ABD3QIB2_9STRA
MAQSDGGHPHDDVENGKTSNSKSRHKAITQIANCTPAIIGTNRPLSSRRRCCGFRRRSDVALIIIAALIVVLCVMHVAFHSVNLPHGSTKMTTDGGGPPAALAARHAKSSLKSALETKLDEFVKARAGGGDGSETGYLKKTTPSKEELMEKEQEQRWQREQRQLQQRLKQQQQQPPPSSSSPPPPQNGQQQQRQQNQQRERSDPDPPQKEGKEQQNRQQRKQSHPVAHLNCEDHGGPTDPRVVDEMVFWSDIPTDSSYVSPMHPLRDPRTPDDVERYLTFEPDHGGWNNIRMAMETVLVMSHAMGRTLVLPPRQRMYLMDASDSLGFDDFFHLDAISVEHRGFKVISMEEFLDRVGMAGELPSVVVGADNTKKYPPGNRTNFDARMNVENHVDELWDYLRDDTLISIMNGTNGRPRPTLEEFNGHPTPVNASVADRDEEMLADRENLCISDEELQGSKLLHLMVRYKPTEVRLLTHFYAFIFFADWRQDLWSKRFVRDHLRYVDEIVCAAARVVEAVRDHARRNDKHNASRDDGIYDAVHVRRGDFQYTPTRLPADELYRLSPELTEGATLYVATDERDKEFFNIFKEHYDVVFLDDFLHVIKDMDTNVRSEKLFPPSLPRKYYGMIEQLVAYKSRVFYGTWWSTLSGYVNRMRGYYIAKHKLEGYIDGTMKSWYFTPEERVLQMREYIPVRKPIYCREFPISWRDIDHGVDEIAST